MGCLKYEIFKRKTDRGNLKDSEGVAVSRDVLRPSRGSSKVARVVGCP